jgi:hypothetical protein
MGKLYLTFLPYNKPTPEPTHLKHEDGDSIDLRNVGIGPQNYTVLTSVLIAAAAIISELLDCEAV